MMNDRELATVMAALRAIQNVQQHEALAPEIDDIATDGGRYTALDHGEIDALCHRLNVGAPSRIAAFTAEERTLIADALAVVSPDDEKAVNMALILESEFLDA
jgi:hypothetical protein